MADKILNFGILGCGMIADFHAQAIKSLNNAVLVGVTDNNTSRAKAFAEKYNVKTYLDYAQMLSDDNIDAVCICTPSGFHAENALAALKAKKHVVLEKPMAFTSSKTQEIAQAANNSGCILTVISQLRFSEDIQRVKKLMNEEAFGKIVFCDLYMKYWRSPEYYSSSDWKGTRKLDGGGALMNQGIHGVDILLYLAGNAKVLSAKNATLFHDIEVEDVTASLLEFESGALGVIEASTCSNPGFERRIEITGTKGSVVLLENKIDKLIINGETLVDGISESVARTASDPMAMSCSLHALQINNFVNAVFGAEKLLIDSFEGSKAVTLIDEIYKY